jgi:hypothetical protein
LAEIAPTVAVKFAVLNPGDTFTDAGTVNAVLLLESATATPPEAAACERVTVHVAI